MGAGDYLVPRRLVYLGPELDAAVVAYLGKHPGGFSGLVRHALATYIGQPDLAAGIRAGRPEKEAAPVKKRAAKKRKGAK